MSLEPEGSLHVVHIERVFQRERMSLSRGPCLDDTHYSSIIGMKHL